MAWFRVLTAAALALAAQGAAAETLRVVNLHPAANDDVAVLRSVAVVPFAGGDGDRLGFLIEDRLRQATLDGEPWLAMVDPQQARSADAVLEGVAHAQLLETRYTDLREACVERDQHGNCVRRENVEAHCLRVSATLRPQLRLTRYDGRLLWTNEPFRRQDFAWCPDFDHAPQIDATIDGWIGQIAYDARAALVPSRYSRDVRIMERASGLDRAARRAFRDAIRITERNPASACAAFAQLHAANPQQPSLIFNVGLCAESVGDRDLAFAKYHAALPDRTSDDEANAGLDRLSRHLHGSRQLALRQHS